MERETGIEPVTSSLGSWRSTAELLPLAGKRAAYARANQSLALEAGGNNLLEQLTLPHEQVLLESLLGEILWLPDKAMVTAVGVSRSQELTIHSGRHNIPLAKRQAKRPW